MIQLAGRPGLMEDIPIKRAKKIWLADAVLGGVVIGIASLALGLYAGARIAQGTVPFLAPKAQGLSPFDRRQIETRVYSVCDHEFGTARSEAAYIEAHNKCMAIARVTAGLLTEGAR